MEAAYEARRGLFLRRLAGLRPGIVEASKIMLEDHPEVQDGGPLLEGGFSAGADRGMWGMGRFRELAAGEVGHWPYETAYNSPQPFRVPETEESAPEILMMEILRFREDALRGEELRDVRPMSARFRDAYRNLGRRYSESVEAFVHWKSTGPEGAAHDLFLTARGLENPEAAAWSIWEGENTDLARLAENLARLGVYRLMRDPSAGTGLDEVAHRMADEQVATHRLLLGRAAEGLRPALEREPSVLRMLRKVAEKLRGAP